VLDGHGSTPDQQHVRRNRSGNDWIHNHPAPIDFGCQLSIFLCTGVVGDNPRNHRLHDDVNTHQSERWRLRVGVASFWWMAWRIAWMAWRAPCINGILRS